MIRSKVILSCSKTLKDVTFLQKKTFTLTKKYILVELSSVIKISTTISNISVLLEVPTKTMNCLKKFYNKNQRYRY